MREVEGAAASSFEAIHQARRDGVPVVLRGATVIVGHDDVRPRADVVIRGDRVHSIGDASSPADDGDSLVVDLRGHLVAAGFVDTHRHCWQGQLRRAIPDATIWDYSAFTHQGVAARYTPGDTWVGTLSSAAAALECGITTLVDWSHNSRTPDHADAAIAAVGSAGLRAQHVYAAPRFASTGHPHPHDVGRVLHQAAAASARGLVSVALGGFMLSTAGDVDERSVTSGDVGSLVRIAREHGIRTSIEGVVGPGAEAFLEDLANRDCLGPDVTLVHCTGLSDRAWSIAAASSAAVSLAPGSELHMQIPGEQGIVGARRHGIVPSLSIDVETSVPSDMFHQMRVLLAWTRAHQLDRDDVPLLSTAEVLRHATEGGAAAVGLGGRIGRVEPGHLADLVVVSASSVAMMGDDPLGSLVLGATPADVRGVLVGGEPVKWNGSLRTVDVDDLRERVTSSRARLMHATGRSS